MSQASLSELLASDVLPSHNRSRRRWIRQFTRSPIALASLGLILFAIILAFGADLIAPYDPLETNVRIRLSEPTLAHPFGTDALGRDVLSRMIFGVRASLMAAGFAVALSVTVGVTFGLMAGYVGGLVDEIVMRAVDTITAFPPIVLALVFVTAFGASLRSVVVALAVVSIPLYARLMRAQVLPTKESDFVLAAHCSGASPVRVVLRHILPNVVAPIIVAATLGMSYAILAEASLSFLGAGVQPPTPTWGGMLNDAARYIHTNSYMTVFPGAAIFILVLSLNFLGDTLQDALDPRSS